MWQVYIIQTKDGRFYTGITSDLARRMKEHEKGVGSRFTKSFGFEKLLYHESCIDRKNALRREIEIKRLPKERKLKLTQTEMS
jgi:putative endonuclease